MNFPIQLLTKATSPSFSDSDSWRKNSASQQNIAFVGSLYLSKDRNVVYLIKIVAMKNKVAFLFIIGLVLFSCENTEEQSEAVSNEVARIAVEGMVCEMGCGGAIRKELFATEAVDQVDVDFDEEASENIIAVHFDNRKISTDEILKKIGEINENQFTATLKGTEPLKAYDKSKKSAQNDSNKEEKSYVNAKESYFSFPNLTRWLNGLIH